MQSSLHGIEKVERKCLMNEVDVIKVDPKNTSRIGKEKYTKIKGLSESGNRMIQKDGVNIEMLPDDWKRTWHVI